MFRFSLEKVLNYRSRLVEQEARKLRLIAVQLEDIKADRRRLDDEGRRMVQDEITRSNGNLDLSRFRCFSGWLNRHREYIRQCDEQAREVQVMLENQRSVLLKHKHDESVLLKLKERHFDAWTLETIRDERKLMDEAGSRIFHAEGAVEPFEGVGDA